MPDGSRKRLEELRARYELNNDFQDVYVEGPGHAKFLRRFFRAVGLRNVKVYEIQAFHVPACDVLGLGLEDNNRGRIVYLAAFLDRHLSGGRNQVRCVADSDFDCVLGSFNQYHCLLYTDYTSRQMYAFRRDTIQSFLIVQNAPSHIETRKLLSAFSKVLQRLFLFRLANRQLQWGMQPLESGFKKCCELNDDLPVLVETEYVRRYLNKNQRLHMLPDFRSEIDKLEPKLTDDPRKQIHGHDFVQLLCWWLRKVCKIQMKEEEAEEELLRLLDADELLSESLFAALNACFQTQAGNG